MKRMLLPLLFTSCIISGAASANTVDDMLKKYQAEGANDFSAKRGKEMWFTDHPDPKNPGEVRNCTTCHGEDLTKKGKHVKTGKVIDPMAPSVNKERLTDPKKIRKWFKRNCKFVLQRKCTPQEKGDFLMFLRNQ